MEDTITKNKNEIKIALVTIAIGPDYYHKYTLLFMNSHNLYAMKNGYDFFILTDFIDQNIKHYNTISFNKILVCELFKKYDYVIYIDADIFINPLSDPIHICAKNTEKICIVNEAEQLSEEDYSNLKKKMSWEANATEYYKLAQLDIDTNIVLNTGVMIFQPKLHCNFLRQIYDKYILKSLSHPRGYHYEQSCVGYELQKENMFLCIPNKFNAIWSLEKLSHPETDLIDFFKNNYFIHFAGHFDLDNVNKLFPFLRITR